MDFLNELNSEIGPMLVAEKHDADYGSVFKVRLVDSPMIDGCCLNVSKAFKATVERIGEKHFATKPMFNNTETTWWF